MKYFLITLTVLLAIIGWIKPKQIPTWISLIAIGLIVAIGVVQALIARSEQLEKLKGAYTGILSSDSIILWGQKKVFPKLEIGDSGAVLQYTGPQGASLLQIFDDTSLAIWVKHGEMRVSTLIRDRTGRIIAELRSNEWKVKPERIWDRNFSSDALEVVDDTGDVVLQVRLVQDRVQFSGKFYNRNGQGVGIGKVIGPSGTGGGIEITGPAHPSLELRIAPLFKYPSNRHLGEFVHN